MDDFGRLWTIMDDCERLVWQEQRVCFVDEAIVRQKRSETPSS
jgi:hypothetical protein